jgi:hypothetical protein
MVAHWAGGETPALAAALNTPLIAAGRVASQLAPGLTFALLERRAHSERRQTMRGGRRQTDIQHRAAEWPRLPRQTPVTTLRAAAAVHGEH